MKETYAKIVIPYKRYFHIVSEKENGWWGQPLLSEILGQTDPVGVKTPILSRHSPVAPQP